MIRGYPPPSTDLCIADWIHLLKERDAEIERLWGHIVAMRNAALTEDRQLELVWNLPVPYSTFNPINFETDQVETKPGAGSAWLYVEPDGDVLPDQDINQVLGNLLTDTWEAIWKKSKNALHG